jgi:glutathione S-transferase
MLRVLGRVSSINVRKVLWTCAEIGVPYTREDWGAGFRPTSEPAFTTLNPNALVPVVIASDDDGSEFVLWESNTICRWLAAEHGRSDLLPAAPRERANVERWMDWQAGELNNSWRYAFMGLVRHSPQHQDSARIEASAREWNQRMALLDTQLRRSSGFVAGPDFTLADIVLGMSAHRWRSTPIDRPALPAVEAWLARLAQRPPFVELALRGAP